MSASLDKALLDFKLSLIRREIADTAPLFDLLSVRNPDQVEIRAAGSVLQSVYNGMETVLALFVEDTDGGKAAWHRDLLDAASTTLALSDDLRLRLEMLRKFRHKYRHAYGFMLDWALMRDMFLELPILATEFESVIEKHLASEGADQR